MENNQEQQSVALAMMDNASDNTSTATKANPKVTVDFAKNFGGEFTDDGFGVDVDKVIFIWQELLVLKILP